MISTRKLLHLNRNFPSYFQRRFRQRQTPRASCRSGEFAYLRAHFSKKPSWLGTTSDLTSDRNSSKLLSNAIIMRRGINRNDKPGDRQSNQTVCVSSNRAGKAGPVRWASYRRKDGHGPSPAASDPPAHQRAGPGIRRRILGDPARPPARTRRADRHQERLRPRPVRRLHRPARRPPHEFLPDPGRHAGRPRGHHRRGPGAGKARRCIRCSRPSSTATPSSAATAPRARSARPPA
jgi:hypothetical protein